jgi:ferrous iron transport protein A
MKPIDLLYRWTALPHPGAGAAPWPAQIQETVGVAAGGQQVTLADLRINERGVVLGLSGGRAVIQRLAALGFTPGADVEMAQNYGWGPLIVITRGARVALGRGEAQLVTVECKKP